MIKMSYHEMSNFQFQSAKQKLENAPTDGHTAYRISKIVRELDAKRKEIADEYRKDIIEVFAKRDEKGEYSEHDWTPDESRQEEFTKAQEDFGNREFTVRRPKLTAHDVRDAKLSAAELTQLGPILDEESFERGERRGPAIGRVG